MGIVMTFTSILGSACRVASQEVDPKVYQAVLACSFIVVFGAPLGSLFLKPKYEVKLRSLFYLFAGLQLIVYGLIKIRESDGMVRYVYRHWNMYTCLNGFSFKK